MVSGKSWSKYVRKQEEEIKEHG